MNERLMQAFGDLPDAGEYADELEADCGIREFDWEERPKAYSVREAERAARELARLIFDV